MQILSLYAALLALLFIFLSVRTLNLRRALQIAVGDGGDKHMLRAMRVHANFAEYVPLCLILLYLVQGQGASPWLLHGLGTALLVGRISHAYGVSQIKENLLFRVAGMLLTFTTLGGSALYLLFNFFVA